MTIEVISIELYKATCTFVSCAMHHSEWLPTPRCSQIIQQLTRFETAFFIVKDATRCSPEENGAWWFRVRFCALSPEGLRFESHSSRQGIFKAGFITAKNV